MSIKLAQRGAAIAKCIPSCRPKLPKNDFTRKIKDFDAFIKVAL